MKEVVMVPVRVVFMLAVDNPNQHLEKILTAEALGSSDIHNRSE